MSGAAAAPYAIVNGADGMFDVIRRSTPAAAPTGEEEALFALAQRLLVDARDRLDVKATLPEDFLKKLRAEVERGLCVTPRHTAAARVEISRLEKALRGPFLIDKELIGDMVAMRRNPVAPLTDEQRSFVAELEQAESVILSLYRDGGRAERKKAAQLSLRSAAVLALMHVPGDVKLARLSIQGAVQTAVREAGQGARVRYLAGLGQSYAYTLFRFLVAIVALWGLQHVWPAHLNFPQTLRVPGEQMMLLGVAVATFFAGAWLSAASRLQPNSPEVLSAIFNETFSAGVRSFYLLGFGLLALLLLHLQIVVFSLGPEGAALFTSADALKTLSASILTGAFLGLGEAALPGAVSERSKGLVAALGATPAGR